MRPSERPIPAKPTEGQQIEQNILQKKAKMSKKSEKAEPTIQIELKKKQFIEIKPSGVY